MITYEMIQDAQEQLISHWKDAGKCVIEETAKVSPFNGDSKKFLDYCTACGGNWGRDAPDRDSETLSGGVGCYP